MKFFLVRSSTLTVVQAENEDDALEHFGCKQSGHSVEWNSTRFLELPDPVEVNTTDHWAGWWIAVKFFRKRLGLE